MDSFIVSWSTGGLNGLNQVMDRLKQWNKMMEKIVILTVTHE